MALLNWDFGAERQPRLEDVRVVLRRPRAADFGEWAALRGRSEAALRPFEPQWADDELTRAAYRRRLRRYSEESAAGLAAPFFVIERATGALAGGINVSNIRRGVSQDCTIGYWLGQGFTGRGLMTSAVRLVVAHCFEDLGLHRVSAACLPHNAASRAVLARAGFREEGYARGYLRIAGGWADHVLFGHVRGDHGG